LAAIRSPTTIAPARSPLLPPAADRINGAIRTTGGAPSRFSGGLREIHFAAGS
jgi:hypothetical protein